MSHTPPNAASQLPAIHVLCIKWGKLYNAADVNKLANGVRRNTTRPINFYCFTEDAHDLQPDIIVHPLPALDVPPEDRRHAYPKTMGLSADDLIGLTGERVFFFDLDSVIVGNLDELFAYPQDDRVYIINDWNHRRGPKANKVGQASCYSWIVGTLGYIKEYFEAHSKEVLAQYGSASQQFLSNKIVERQGALAFWPEAWFCSYRYHCIPQAFLRRFVTPRMPPQAGLKMIAFHGVPSIPDAIRGEWCSNPHSSKRAKGWKRLYKYVLPAKWIEQYWY